MKYLIIFCCLIMAAPALATDSNEAQTPPAQTLQGQYNGLRSEMEVIDGYRMMKMYVMDKFWQTVMDSAQAQRTLLAQSMTLTEQQAKEISALKTSLAAGKDAREALEAGVDNLVVFGQPYSKVGFISTTWFVIAGLVVGAVLLFLTSRRSFVVARELRKLNENMYQEFETYKHHAVEKQIKLSRELQDYRNRVGELKSA
jgi:HAMP domain-containing protein